VDYSVAREATHKVMEETVAVAVAVGLWEVVFVLSAVVYV
jgi:hypothetical protein